MKLPTLIAVLALAGAVATGTAYQLQGQRIDENGILREPFALIPITYALIAISGVSAAVSLAGRKR
ncbi:DUF3955 domain-containing protein [Synechococcus sp. CCY9202]|jgi:hypothetical protein|uniref:DUF3955 domain-containing protein n=1 Tax=Synechococcus sp. CCY9202 TaxID=174698 RepID=UPI002B214B1C|nr:DUF3955 domain-containing protein [Synechococcus sp. CCY9202]MEA5422579.1 DUF3955 domain-containing protein [Synechococcus sp. CCY9202]